MGIKCAGKGYKDRTKQDSETCPRLSGKAFVISQHNFVLISLLVIKVAEREVVSGLLPPLCGLTFIFRLRVDYSQRDLSV